MCLEHRSQPLVLFCQYCQQAICRECMADHQGCEVEAIDNVAEKQIAMMELIDAGQNKLNATFQHTKQTIDEACSFLIQTVHEAQKGLYSQLESIYGYKQLQLTMIEKEVQKVTKKMSQTIEFTQRLLKYSSPTEVIVFKPLLDSRLQGFLTFNADPNNLRDACEIRACALDLQLARQTVYQMVNQLRSDSWLQSPGGGASASPPGFADQFVPTKTDFFDTNRTSAVARAFGDGAMEQLGSFGSFSSPMGSGAATALGSSAPTGTNGFGTVGGMQDSKSSKQQGSEHREHVQLLLMIYIIAVVVVVVVGPPGQAED
uniref:B box-type domain-containing protein n=1 Tax=Globodera pallida TaxID=36090 RepID=A0A183BT60_GLOPA